MIVENLLRAAKSLIALMPIDDELTANAAHRRERATHQRSEAEMTINSAGQDQAVTRIPGDPEHGNRGKKNSDHSAAYAEQTDANSAKQAIVTCGAKLKWLTTIRLANDHMPAQIASIDSVTARLADDFCRGTRSMLDKIRLQTKRHQDHTRTATAA